MRVVTVIGARPQFIKAAAVSRAIRMYNESAGDRQTLIHEVIVHTGQHFDENMSEVFFREMEIPRPKYHLEINSLSHGAMTGRMLEKIEDVLLLEQPDIVMVYGDTNSTLAGALAAKKLHIRVVHVEAGLRSFNMQMPEEINRILTDRISDLLCCPTDSAVANLKKEGFEEYNCRIAKTGDVMQDAALYYSGIARQRSDVATRLGLKGIRYALCTIHRAENTDDPVRLSGIIEALNIISTEMRVVLPLHPRTRKIIESSGVVPGFETIDPAGYFDMIELLRGCSIVLTDSGGVQKESFFFERPCVTLRDETEWVELVEHGYNMLAGAEKNKIVNCYREMLARKSDYSLDLYGAGEASAAIVREMITISGETC